MGVFIDIYSVKHIGSEKYASDFFDLMNKNGLNIEKIGLFEPVKEPFSIEEAIDMWVKEEPGIYEITEDKMIGKSGGMLGKGKGYWFDTHWCVHPTELSLNYLTIYLNNKVFNLIKDDIFLLFEELVDCFEAIYGYVTEEKAEERQHITGTLKERIPGVFWLNYFSHVLVEYLNDEGSLYEFPWQKVKSVTNDGIITQLTNHPYDQIIVDLENRAQEQFGFSKFNGTAKDYPKILMP